MTKDIDPRVLRMKQLAHYTALSRAFLYEKIKEGSFPEGYMISTGIRVWLKSEVDDWLDLQMARA